MKFSIEIPDEALLKMVQDITVERVKSVLREWASSPEARMAIQQQWMLSEDRILDGLFDDWELERRDLEIIGRVKRSFTNLATRRAKVRDAALSVAHEPRPPAPPAEPT